jgi:hypothetical protein
MDGGVDKRSCVDPDRLGLELAGDLVEQRLVQVRSCPMRTLSLRRPPESHPYPNIFEWCLKPTLCPSDSEHRGVP